MSPLQYVLAGLATLIASGVLIQILPPLIGPVVQQIFGNKQKKIEAAAEITVKQIPDATQVNNNLFARLAAVEARLDKEEARCTRLERIVNRVCWAYENLRELVMKIVRLLRAGKTVPEDLLAEVERAPDRDALLQQAAKDIPT